VALVRTDVSEESNASNIKVQVISKVRITLMEAITTSKTSVLTRATQSNIPEDGIPQCHRLEILKSYIVLADWAL
jgi:hypothetical protein